MADDTTQTGEETSWWDLNIFADSELPSTSFDEPLEWPETIDWGDFSAGDSDLEFPGTGDAEFDLIFPPASDPAPAAPEPASRPEPAKAPDAQLRAAGDDGDPTMPHVTVLSGLGGGGSPPAAPAAEHTVHEHLPDALWAGDAGATSNGNVVSPVVTAPKAGPTFHPQRDGGAGGWRRRFDIRHGNAAVIALISFVSLILLGMFMSVRARNQTPDTSQTRTTSDQIQVQGTLSTVPLTTTVTTTAPTINIADLVPPAEDATATTAAAAGGGSTGRSPATTAAPARSAPTGATGTTQPAAQPTNTTAAPQNTAPPETAPPETTTPPATSPPVTDSTTPSTPRRTTPSLPTVTSTVPPDTTFPSVPGFPSIPGFNNNNNDN